MGMQTLGMAGKSVMWVIMIEVEADGYWTRLIGQIPGQFDVPTSSTPAPRHLSGFDRVCGAK